jgi:hypothetical protein
MFISTNASDHMYRKNMDRLLAALGIGFDLSVMGIMDPDHTTFMGGSVPLHALHLERSWMPGDLDIFCHSGTEKQLVNLFTSNGFYEDKLDVHTYKHMEQEMTIRRMHNLVKNDTSVQLIVLTNPTKMEDLKFDITVCECFYDFTKLYVGSPAFTLQDVFAIDERYTVDRKRTLERARKYENRGFSRARCDDIIESMRTLMV